SRITKMINDAHFTEDDALLPVGSFDLSGNGDLRGKKLKGGVNTIAEWFDRGEANLTDLVPTAAGALESIEAKIAKGGPLVKGAIGGVFEVIQQGLRSLENGFHFGLHFPVLENPTSVFQLLLGQDVKFVTFDARFSFAARLDNSISAFGVLQAGF